MIHGENLFQSHLLCGRKGQCPLSRVTGSITRCRCPNQQTSMNSRGRQGLCPGFTGVGTQGGLHPAPVEGDELRCRWPWAGGSSSAIERLRRRPRCRRYGWATLAPSPGCSSFLPSCFEGKTTLRKSKLGEKVLIGSRLESLGYRLPWQGSKGRN